VNYLAFTTSSKYQIPPSEQKKRIATRYGTTRRSDCRARARLFAFNALVRGEIQISIILSTCEEEGVSDILASPCIDHPIILLVLSKTRLPCFCQRRLHISATVTVHCCREASTSRCFKRRENETEERFARTRWWFLRSQLLPPSQF